MTDTLDHGDAAAFTRKLVAENPEMTGVEVVREVLAFHEGHAAGARVQVKSEPLTYDRFAPVSYFADLVGMHQGDERARIRLNRHATEMAVEMPKRQARARALAEGTGAELRVNPNPTQGQGGYFDPPLWLIEEFAVAPRAERVLVSMVPNFPMPQGVSSINLPRITTGTAAGPQVPLEGVDESDLADAAVTHKVITIAGEGDVALQLLEQSPQGAHFDWAVFKDLTSAYDANFEAQIINGLGNASGQLLGVLNVTGINAVTFTNASPTGILMYASFGYAAAQIGDNRRAPPECWLMRTARWAWLASSEDSSMRPFETPGKAGPGPGSLLGWNVLTDDAIPATLGAGGNQDAVIVIRPSDLMVFESEPRTAIQTEVLSSTLGVRLQLRSYVSALTGRYPSSIGTIQGTGMVVQANE